MAIETHFYELVPDISRYFAHRNHLNRVGVLGCAAVLHGTKGERGTIALVERMAATKLLMDPNPQNLVSGPWARRYERSDRTLLL